MLLNDVNYNVNEFKQIFKKKFDNFCKKAPILMSYVLANDSVDLYSHDDEKQSKKLFTYTFDYRTGVKENIKMIKDTLLDNHYPVMIEERVTYIDYSAEELNQLVSEGKISLNHVSTVKREIKDLIQWRIERVIVVRDEIFIRNLTDNTVFRYRMRIPVTVFLKKCRINFTPTEAFNYFSQKSQLKNEILENYEYPKEIISEHK